MKKATMLFLNYGLIWQPNKNSPQLKKIMLKEKKRVERGLSDGERLIELFITNGKVEIKNLNHFLKYLEAPEYKKYLEDQKFYKLYTSVWKGQLETRVQLNKYNPPGTNKNYKKKTEMLYRSVVPEIDNIKEEGLSEIRKKMINPVRQLMNAGYFTDYQVKIASRAVNKEIAELEKRITDRIYTKQFHQRLLELIIEDLNDETKQKRTKAMQNTIKWMEPFINAAKK